MKKKFDVFELIDWAVLNNLKIEVGSNENIIYISLPDENLIVINYYRKADKIYLFVETPRGNLCLEIDELTIKKLQVSILELKEYEKENALNFLFYTMTPKTDTIKDINDVFDE